MTEAGEMNFAKSQNTSALRRSPIRFPPLRVAGQSIEEEIRRLSDQLNDRLVLAAVFLVITVLEWYTWWFSLPPNPGLITLVTILVVAFAVRTVFRHRRAMANLKQGLAGERTVGFVLEELRVQGYRVFHDIPGANFNIDHVIIGPTGIYTIETKTLSKPFRGQSKIIYDGDNLRRDDGLSMDEDLDQACAQTRWLADLLNQGRKEVYTVTPVLLYTGWWVENIASKEKRRVWVLNEKALSSFLAHESSVLSSAEVDALANSLSQYCRLTLSVHNMAP